MQEGETKNLFTQNLRELIEKRAAEPRPDPKDDDPELPTLGGTKDIAIDGKTAQVTPERFFYRILYEGDTYKVFCKPSDAVRTGKSIAKIIANKDPAPETVEFFEQVLSAYREQNFSEGRKIYEKLYPQIPRKPCYKYYTIEGVEVGISGDSEAGDPFYDIKIGGVEYKIFGERQYDDKRPIKNRRGYAFYLGSLKSSEGGPIDEKTRNIIIKAIKADYSSEKTCFIDFR